MRTLLRELSYIVTCDGEGREITNADILVEGPEIEAIGKDLSTEGVDRVIDGRELLAMPGLINGHLHTWQTVARSVPDLQLASLDAIIDRVAVRPAQWWREGRFDAESLRLVARAVMVESLLGGVTTLADQHLLFPVDPARPDYVEPWVEATIQAAEDVGVRLHVCRGTVTRSHGAPVERVDGVVAHCRELIERYHDPTPFAQIRIALAPSGVHLDVPEMFEAFADLADQYESVRLHTHLYEETDARAAEELYHMSPWEFMKRHRWADERVWFGHVNAPLPGEIAEFAEAGVGIVHTPSAEMKMGWPLTPLRAYLDAGITVGLGNSSPAGGETNQLMPELRLAFFANRLGGGPPESWLTQRELLQMVTAGSARCIGRADLGVLAPGMAADIACWDVSGVGLVGSHDPVAALVTAGGLEGASLVLVNGEILIRDGRPARLDAAEVAEAARRAIPSGGWGAG